MSLPISLSARRKWAFRVLAILLGLIPLTGIELLLRALPLPAADVSVDPFVGFSAVHPLFELTDDGQQFEIASSRQKFFAVDSFSADKNPAEFRIFCLGGSTVQGRPYSISTSFAAWLEIALNEVAPQRQWNTVNCGGISYASYRLIPILQECLQYQPDLFIVCTGHNEFLEDRTYGHIKSVSRGWSRSLHWGSRLRTVRLLSEWMDPQSPKSILSAETDPMLDYQRGLEAFHRDSERSAAVARHYEFNLRRMAHICRQAKVPLIFVRPCSNLADCPPFKVEPQTNLGSSAQQKKQELLAQLSSDVSLPLSKQSEILRTMTTLDPLDAGLWYRLGKTEHLRHRRESALQAYLQARDTDVCPLRMTAPLVQALQRVAQEESVPLLDAHELLQAKAVDRILGDFWLVDHIHPSFAGHQEIALALAENMKENGWVAWHEDLRGATKQTFAEHFASLEKSYFHHGQRMLQQLREWTRGNADGPDVKTRFPHRLRTDASGERGGYTPRPAVRS